MQRFKAAKLFLSILKYLQELSEV